MYRTIILNFTNMSIILFIIVIIVNFLFLLSFMFMLLIIIIRMTTFYTTLNNKPILELIVLKVILKGRINQLSTHIDFEFDNITIITLQQLFDNKIPMLA